MSVVAFSFGSFGDIITLLQVISGTCKLLTDCYDATSQRQETIEYLCAFSNALRCLSPLYASGDQHESQRSQLPVATVNAIRHSVDKCAQEIQQFHARVRTAAPSADASPSARVATRIRDSLQWSLSLNSESVKLRRVLREQKGLIDTILAAQIAQNMLIRAGSGIYSINSGYNFIAGRSNPDGVLLLDILNEEVHIPIECCFSYQIFVEFLVFLFRERVGGAYIRAGLYKISHSKRRTSLDAKSWSSLVTPGATIELAVVAQRRIHGLQFDPKVCPRCGGTSRADMWETTSQCTRCRNFISFTGPIASFRHEEVTIPPEGMNDWQFIRRFCYEVFAVDGPTPTRELYLEESLRYLDNMKSSVDTWTYQQFLDTLSAFHRQVINNEEVFQRPNVLLRACPRLVNMFCFFLPPGCCMEYTATPGSADVVRLTTASPIGRHVTPQYPALVGEALDDDAVTAVEGAVVKHTT